MKDSYASLLPDLSYLSANVAFLDAESKIVAVNENWQRFAVENGLGNGAAIGSNYLDICRAGLGRDHRLCSDLARLLRGRTDLVTWTYDCHSPTQHRWFTMLGFPLVSNAARAALLHIDITALFNTDALSEGIATSRPVLMPESFKVVTSTPQDRVPARQPPRSRPRQGPRWPLTARQNEVYRLLGLGLDDADIAARLNLAPRTVELHVKEILRRLSLRSREVAVMLASEQKSAGPDGGG